MKDVYITKVASYLPNNPIENDQMESFIGFIGGKPSRVRSIVLRQNGIKTRYYGIDKSQKMTHTNALLAKNAVCNLFDDNKIPEDVICYLVPQVLLINCCHPMLQWYTESYRIVLWKFIQVQGCVLLHYKL